MEQSETFENLFQSRVEQGDWSGWPRQDGFLNENVPTKYLSIMSSTNESISYPFSDVATVAALIPFLMLCPAINLSDADPIPNQLLRTCVDGIQTLSP